MTHADHDSRARTDAARSRSTTGAKQATSQTPKATRPTVQEHAAKDRTHRSDTMKAVVQDSYGPPEVLELREVAIPEPAAHEVLVRVCAAGLNHSDWTIMRGEPTCFAWRSGCARRRRRYGAATSPAWSRRWAQTSPASARETRLYAETERGTFAQYTIVPERLLARKPTGLTFEEAAATPLAGVTALRA